MSIRTLRIWHELHISFLEFNGANILQHLMDKCLDETTNYSSLLLPLIKCIKVVLVHNIDKFEQEKLLYGLTRSLFLFHDNFDASDEGFTTSYSALKSPSNSEIFQLSILSNLPRKISWKQLMFDFPQFFLPFLIATVSSDPYNQYILHFHFQINFEKNS